MDFEQTLKETKNEWQDIHLELYNEGQNCDIFAVSEDGTKELLHKKLYTSRALPMVTCYIKSLSEGSNA